MAGKSTFYRTYVDYERKTSSQGQKSRMLLGNVKLHDWSLRINTNLLHKNNKMFTNGQGYHLFIWVWRQLHSVDEFPDRIAAVPGHCCSLDVPFSDGSTSLRLHDHVHGAVRLVLCVVTGIHQHDKITFIQVI